MSDAAHGRAPDVGALVDLLRAGEYAKAEEALGALNRVLGEAGRVESDALGECLGYDALDTLRVDTPRDVRALARVVEEASLVLQFSRGQFAAAAAGWRARAEGPRGTLADRANALLSEWRAQLCNEATHTTHAELQAVQRAERLAARVSRERDGSVPQDEVRWHAACLCLWVVSTCGATRAAQRVLRTCVLPAAMDVLTQRAGGRGGGVARVFAGDAVRLVNAPVAADTLPSIQAGAEEVRGMDVAACASARAEYIRAGTLVACALQRLRDDAAWGDAAALLEAAGPRAGPRATKLRALCMLSAARYDECVALCAPLLEDCAESAYLGALAHVCAERWDDARARLEALAARDALPPVMRSRVLNALAVVHGVEGRLLASIGALKRALKAHLCATALHNAVQVYAALGSHASHQAMLVYLLRASGISEREPAAAADADDGDGVLPASGRTAASGVAAVLALPPTIRADTSLAPSDHLRRMHQLARLHCARGRWGDALTMLGAIDARVARGGGAWSARAERSALLTDRAHVLLQLQRYDDCLAHTARVLARGGGEHVPLLMHRADALLCVDRPADALAAVDTVLRVLDAGEQGTAPARASKRRRKARRRAAAAAARDCGVEWGDAAAVCAWRVRAYCNRAVLLCCCADTHAHAAAAAALRAALNLDPECTAAAYNLALLLYRDGHAADACRVWLDHRRLDSDEVHVLEEHLRAATAAAAVIEPAREHVRGSVSTGTARKLDELMLRERVDALLAQRREVLAAELFADLDDSAFDFELP